MSTPRKGLIARLDAAAESTGILGAGAGFPRRRHLRWLPVAPLALGIAGELLVLLRPDLDAAALALVMAAFALAALVPIAGPIKPWGSPEHVDEFDRAIRDRAYFATFAAMSGTAMVGIWLTLGITLATNAPREVLMVEMGVLGTFLFVIYFALPTLHASWATRPIEDD